MWNYGNDPHRSLTPAEHELQDRIEDASDTMWEVRKFVEDFARLIAPVARKQKLRLSVDTVESLIEGIAENVMSEPDFLSDYRLAREHLSREAASYTPCGVRELAQEIVDAINAHADTRPTNPATIAAIGKPL